MFDESEGSGINEYLSEFWNSWEDLAANPSGDVERATLVNNAATLADRLNQLAAGLEDMRQEIDVEIAAAVEEVNQITSQISEMNSKLVQYRASGRNTDSIEDSLDYLAEQLSTLVDVTTYENSDGQLCAQLAGGQPLVQGDASWSLETSVDSSTGLFDVLWNDGSGAATSVQDSITGGVLGGCLAVRDEYIPAYQEDLDELASTLITEVNDLLTAGYDLNGDPGTELFTGSGAGDIAVSQAILDDPSLIAAADAADSAPGDGSVALAVAALRDEALMSGGSSTLDGFYSALVSQVGSDRQNVESDYELRSDLDDFYHNYRESIAGVSLDEESANLLLYQQAYEASARVITVLQEIMETTISM